MWKVQICLYEELSRIYCYLTKKLKLHILNCLKAIYTHLHTQIVAYAEDISVNT